MDKVIADTLSRLEFGELQQFENMAVFPLFCQNGAAPTYLTLEEALEQQLLTVTEVTQSGSVPELKVTSTAELPVLLLDSEELIGAKQNRVLNTSILVKERAEIVIPVSCTEQGRWSYASAAFADSKGMTTSRLRRLKQASVTDSLKERRGYRSDQTEVWGEINAMATQTGTFSSTGAMKAVFDAHTGKLDEYIRAFECQSDQRGLLAFINGKPLGLDMISRQQAYKTLHPKLIKSYAMDALLEKNGGVDKPSLKEATAFLDEIKTCHGERFESVGYGWDHRYQTDTLVGSALTHEEQVIHVAFFRLTEKDRSSRAGLRQRRPPTQGPLPSP